MGSRKVVDNSRYDGMTQRGFQVVVFECGGNGCGFLIASLGYVYWLE